MVPWGLRFLPIGKLEGEALWFSQADYQKKKKTENKDGHCLVPAAWGHFSNPSSEPVLNKSRSP